MSEQEKKLIADALESLAKAITWTMPNSAPTVQEYLLEVWAAIDRLRGDA